MAGLRERIIELAGERRRFGYRRLHILLLREGMNVNHKAVHRIYREEGLQVRRRKRKRIGPADRQPIELPEKINVRWSMNGLIGTACGCTLSSRENRSKTRLSKVSTEGSGMNN